MNNLLENVKYYIYNNIVTEHQIINKDLDKLTYQYEMLYSHIDHIKKEAENIMKENNTLYTIIKLTNIPNEEDKIIWLLKNGLIPLFYIYEPMDFFKDYVVHRILNNMTKDQFEFWINISINIIIDTISNFDEWIIYDKNTIIENAKKYCNSIPLLLYDMNDYLYKNKRPKTDMSLYKQIKSKTYNSLPFGKHKQSNPKGSLDQATTETETSPEGLLALTDDIIKISNYIYEYKNLNCTPVTRYSAGMSKGLYYHDNDYKEYHGTFYYYEPESDVYLCFNKYLIYTNKYEALIDLRKRSNINIPVEFEDLNELDLNLESHKQIYNFINDYFKNTYKCSSDMLCLPEDLKLTPSEYYSIFPDKYSNNINIISDIPSTKTYCGTFTYLYSRDDVFDQEIYILAKNLDIDVIILTKEIGKYQIVTEVLDIRDRISSFEQLIYPS